MIELLTFVFRDGWTFAGCLLFAVLAFFTMATLCTWTPFAGAVRLDVLINRADNRRRATKLSTHQDAALESNARQGAGLSSNTVTRADTGPIATHAEADAQADSSETNTRSEATHIENPPLLVQI